MHFETHHNKMQFNFMALLQKSADSLVSSAQTGPAENTSSQLAQQLIAAAATSRQNMPSESTLAKEAYQML